MASLALRRILALGLCQLACGGSPETGEVPDVHYRAYWKDVRHTSTLNQPQALNAAIATDVWTTRPEESYDSTPGQERFTGYGFPCEFEIIQRTPALSFSTQLDFDSLLPVLDDQQYLLPVVGQLVTQFRDPEAPNMVPVFTVPRLARISQGMIVPWNVFGFAAPTPSYGSAFPSIWLATRRITEAGSYSTFAHEFGHLLAHNEAPSNWHDNDTPFLHILTHQGTDRLTWDSSTAFNVMLVTAADGNRRKLVDVNGRNICNDAKDYSFIREITLEAP